MQASHLIEPGFDVSVIIPTYNRLNFLYPTLICLLHQETKLFYEIIIIDSGNDRTNDYVQNIRFRYQKRVVYKRIEECKNRSKLRNLGASVAEGEVLIFLDNDILVPPDFIQNHYEKQMQLKKTIVLGKRKSLTNFDFGCIGRMFLENHFYMLDNLPWYRDAREKFLSDKGKSIETIHNPWRFMFSHDFSIHKEDYYSAGGFDEKFGENWGFEDIEIGFRLYINNFRFVLDDNITGYHQTHFEETKKAQVEGIENSKVFLSLHNCFEFEIFISFANEFDELYIFLLNIKNKYFDSRKIRKESGLLVLGCLWTADQQKNSDNGFLGTSLPFIKDKAAKDILVLNTFYLFPRQLQCSILSEAIRIGNGRILFEKKDANDIEIITDVATHLGISVAIKEDGTDYELEIVNTASPKSMVIILPDVFTPSKRLTYVLLALHLRKIKFDIILEDLKGTRTLDHENLSIPVESQYQLLPCFTNTFGSVKMTTLFSEDFTRNDAMKFLYDKNFILIRDTDYLPSINLPSESLINRAKTSSFEILEAVSFTELYNIISKKRYFSADGKDFSLFCTMENGFIEDGIDIILEAIRQISQYTLLIQVPDYEALSEGMFPEHNNQSRYGKIFGLLQKYKYDLMMLNEKINKLDLCKKVKIVCRNNSLEETLSLMKKAQSYICLSRGIIPSPLVYASLILKKKTIISSQFIVGNEFRNSCIEIYSDDVSFTDEFHLPVDSENVSIRCRKPNLSKLINTFKSENIKKEVIDVKDCLSIQKYKINKFLVMVND